MKVPLPSRCPDCRSCALCVVAVAHRVQIPVHHIEQPNSPRSGCAPSRTIIGRKERFALGTEFFDHFGRSTRQANPQQAAIADSRRDTESGFVEPGDLFIGDQVSGHSPSNFDSHVAQIRTAKGHPGTIPVHCVAPENIGERLKRHVPLAQVESLFYFFGASDQVGKDEGWAQRKDLSTLLVPDAP